jgi:two-component system, OmpR family, sensor histidine kinase VicK
MSNVNGSYSDDDLFSIHTTRVIKGRKQALADAYSRRLKAKHTLYCITGEELVKSYKPFVPVLRTSIQQHAGSSKIITNIETGSIEAVNQLIEAGAEIRHIDKHMLRRCVVYDNSIAYFSIVEEPVITGEAIENVEETEGQDLWISSVEVAVIESARERFLSDWERAVPSVDRINELEKGKPIEITRVIKDNNEAVEIYKSLIDTANSQILYLLPSARALVRMKSAAILHSLIDSATVRDVKVSILCPIDSENEHIIEQIRKTKNIELRSYESTTSTLLITDREHVFTAELRKNATYNIFEALGLTTYSNSNPTVQSYITLFESLWKQKQLYEQQQQLYDELEESHNQLELANEEVKLHSKMQNEFINVAAHELRTPLQPILSLSDILRHKTTYPEQHELANVIFRNAKRLQRLAENILDVTKIEGGTLKLNKERFNIIELISNIVKDYSIELTKEQKDNKGILSYRPNEKIILVEADSNRIIQVIYNILCNAIKFSKNVSDLVVSITVQKIDNDEVIVNIKDNGTGIDLQILPKLFTKFSTKSQTGTGLGMFISRSIIEAHGGKIWAKNNSDAKGATFTFTLPISQQYK